MDTYKFMRLDGVAHFIPTFDFMGGPRTVAHHTGDSPGPSLRVSETLHRLERRFDPALLADDAAPIASAGPAGEGLPSAFVARWNP